MRIHNTKLEKINADKVCRKQNRKILNFKNGNFKL